MLKQNCICTFYSFQFPINFHLCLGSKCQLKIELNDKYINKYPPHTHIFLQLSTDIHQQIYIPTIFWVTMVICFLYLLESETKKNHTQNKTPKPTKTNHKNQRNKKPHKTKPWKIHILPYSTVLPFFMAVLEYQCKRAVQFTSPAKCWGCHAIRRVYNQNYLLCYILEPYGQWSALPRQNGWAIIF